MMKRSPLVLAALLVACGPGIDDKNNNTVPPNNTSTNNTSMNNTSTNNTSTNNTSTNNTSTNNTSTNNTSTNNTATNNQSTNNSTNNQSTNNSTNNTTTCATDTTFTGQIGSTEGNGGGTVTTTPLSNDAGIDDVLAAVPTTPDDPNTVTNEGRAVLNTPLFVDQARVTATSFSTTDTKRFFIEDGNGRIQIFLDGTIANVVRVGDTVSFDVTEVQNFEGHPQISVLENFSNDSGGNVVPMEDISNRAIEQSDYLKVVRVGGKLGAPYDCGGTDCYSFTYDGGEAVFRSKSNIVGEGDCVTFVGPVYSFPGPEQSDMTPIMQLDTINFDWLTVE